MLTKYYKKEIEKVMLSEYIEQYKTTIVHGESGSGKSIFAVKELNDAGITPVYIDLDDNEINEFETLDAKCELLDGYDFLKDLIIFDDDENIIELNNELIEHLKDKVVIIDTWTLFSGFCGSEYKAYDITKILNKNNITVIILAHTIPYSGKDDKPEIADKIYRHIKARLHIRITKLKTKTEYHLIIEKLRGFLGNKIKLLRIESIDDEMDKLLN